MKTKIEREVCLPEGYELADGYLFDTHQSTGTKYLRFELVKIVPKTFNGLLRIPEGWISKDKNGKVYWFKVKPKLGMNTWQYSDDDVFELSFDPFPKDSPWDKCIMEVKHDFGNSDALLIGKPV